MTNKGTNGIQTQTLNNTIKKRGYMGFSTFQLHPHTAAGVKALGFHTPTPIQKQAIPPALEGRDVLGLAQTGTGKTAAFALPILERLMTGPRGRVRALIIAPTRELAEQIHSEIGKLGRETRLRSVTIYGGVGLNPQIQKLRAGVEIVVACPGRLLDHINQRTIDLSHLEVLVLDEADRMFDMGFLPDIRKIIKHVPAKRQTLLFSATMPDDIRKLAHDVLHNPVTVQVGHTAPANTVSHALYPVPQHLKTALLLELLKHTDTESVLIFTRTKHRAKRVGQQLEKAGYRAASLQGNLSQNKRQEALDGFRKGSYQILVATDIAARGIDVSLISHVINYDMPDTTDAYTHRIGRTGRAAKTGDAFTFVTHEDEAMVRSIERVLGDKVERRTVKGFDYHKQAPARDTEFARPPREPQRRREQKRPEHPAHASAAPRQKSPHAQPAHGTVHRTAAAHSRDNQTQPAREGAHRGHATQRPAGSTVYKSRTRKPRTYR
jgi:ATP-dependent RNA helicase RhlE